MSLGMFSSIPCPYRPWNEKARHLMLVFLPVVGFVIGLIWYGIYFLLGWINTPLQLQAAALMLYPYLITGFIHLDGFMDTSDALLSRRPLEDKLRILKDPHTGAFAVISVLVLFIICFASMTAAVEKISLKTALGIAQGDPMLSLIFIPVVSRCGSSLAVLTGKPLSHSQYREEEGSKKAVPEILAVSVIGILTAAAAAVLGLDVLALKATFVIWPVLAGAVIGYLAALYGAVRQMKGVSGDLAGYSLTIAEAAAIVVLALLA